MTFKWKLVLRCLTGTLLVWVMTGCGGVNASHSVSPASMLLPGLIAAPVEVPSETPEPAAIDDGVELSRLQLAAK